MKTRQEAVAILGHRIPRFSATVSQGFKAYFDHYSDRAGNHSPVTRASIIHDEMVAAAKAIFFDDPGVALVDVNSRDVFIFDDIIATQFKKLDDKLKVRNYPTVAAIDFNANAQKEFEGIPASLSRLSVGYVPDKEFTQINGIFIVCQNERGVFWDIDITHGSVDTKQADFDQQLDATRTRVRIRGTQHDERTATGEV